MTDIFSKIQSYLGDEAEYLLLHKCHTTPAERLHLPGPDFIEKTWIDSDRSPAVLRNMQTLFSHGRIGGTGYLSILPVDQGVEHSAGASFAPNPLYFDPEYIVQLALEAGCNGVASTLGVLGSVARRYAHRIPFIMKINHNELLSFPNKHDQIMFASIDQAFNMGAVAIGATIYFGSPESTRQISEVSSAFEYAHQLGLVCILWCYLRNPAFVKGDVDFHSAADLTGQANHLGATLGADIVKQKLPSGNGGFRALNFGKTNEKVYSSLTTSHPIDETRYQVMNSYMGRVGLINSGGDSGSNDLAQAVRTAVINKRAGGMGLILGRKAFQKSASEGIEIIHAVQDVYLCDSVIIA
ncbi:class I fructose-bisphosphate aldolase [bacterium]|nr:class I fructose-bisphosphate aldolase [candidate division CSSED10-310 bacterium]